MAAINIDMRKVRCANENLPSIIADLSEQRRYIRSLKLNIPLEIQEEKYIGERLNTVLREIDRAEQQMSKIYSIAANAVIQYSSTEKNLMINALRYQ